MDYDDGVPFDELNVLVRYAEKAALERRMSLVEGGAVALHSLFDKKIFKTFMDSIKRVSEALDRGSMHEETKEEKVARTLKNLNEFKKGMEKLGWIGSGGDEIPPWERQ